VPDVPPGPAGHSPTYQKPRRAQPDLPEVGPSPTYQKCCARRTTRPRRAQPDLPRNRCIGMW